ncbi:MAG: hypothetical protein ACPGRX_02905 [Bdellovibrionales bacterium]
MASHTPVDVDPKQLETAQDAWSSFGVAMKWGGVFVALVVVGVVALLLR